MLTPHYHLESRRFFEFGSFFFFLINVCKTLKSLDEGTQLLIGRWKRINNSLQYEECKNILINILNNDSLKFLNYQIIV